MQLTAKSDYLKVSPDIACILGKFADSFSKLEHFLFAEMSVTGKPAQSLKTSFSKKHGLMAREFNAIGISLSSKISSTTGLLKEAKHKVDKDLTKAHAQLKQQEAKIALLKSKPQAERKSKEEFQKLQKRRAWLKDKIRDLTHKQKEIHQQLKAKTPNLCFGTRKLFNQQFIDEKRFAEEMLSKLRHSEQFKRIADEEDKRVLMAEVAEQAKAEAHAKWLEEWQFARSNQFSLVGSKTEKSGNQMCQLRNKVACQIKEADGSQTTDASLFQVQLRIPDHLRHEFQIEPTTLLFDVRIPYGSEWLVNSLEKWVALSFRFIRHRVKHKDTRDFKSKSSSEEVKWTVHVSTDFEIPKVITPIAGLSNKTGFLGAIGVDLNEHHLSVTECDRWGNYVNSFDVPMCLKNKTAEQRKQILSEALDVVISYALKVHKPIGIEDLDFKKLRESLKSVKYLEQSLSKKDFKYIKTQLIDEIERRKEAQAKVFPLEQANASVVAEEANDESANSNKLKNTKSPKTKKAKKSRAKKFKVKRRNKNVQVSSFGYSKFMQLMESKCTRRGVPLFKVEPSYTSVQGRIKYAKRLGLTVHQSAAFVISRLVQGYVEKVPKGQSVKIPLMGAVVTFDLPVRNTQKQDDVSWKAIHRALVSFEKTILQQCYQQSLLAREVREEEERYFQSLMDVCF